MVAALAVRGVAARAVPAQLRTPDARALDGVRAPLVLLSSASAVEPVLASLGPGQRVAAVAPRTARVARTAGLAVALEAGGGALGLATAVRDAWARLGRPDRLVWATSDAGAASDEQSAAREILAGLTGASGRPVEVDVRRCVMLAPDPGLSAAVCAAAAETTCPGLLFASPSAVRAFVAVAADAVPDLTPAAVACVGRSTLDAANRAAPARWPSPERIDATALLDGIAALDGADRRVDRAVTFGTVS
jgi:uroporphyrinogen-III synthase